MKIESGKYNGPIALGFFLVKLFGISVLVSLAESILDRAGITCSEESLFISLDSVVSIILAGIMIILYLEPLKEDLKLFLSKAILRKTLIGLLCAELVMILLNACKVFLLASDDTNISNNMDQVARNTNNYLLFAVALICAPLIEELVYHYILQNSWDGYFSSRLWWGAPLAVGFLFGLMHAGLSTTMIVYVAWYTSVGIIYKKTGCLSSCIFIHSFNNLLALFI